VKSPESSGSVPDEPTGIPAAGDKWSGPRKWLSWVAPNTGCFGLCVALVGVVLGFPLSVWVTTLLELPTSFGSPLAVALAFTLYRAACTRLGNDKPDDHDPTISMWLIFLIIGAVTLGDIYVTELRPRWIRLAKAQRALNAISLVSHAQFRFQAASTTGPRGQAYAGSCEELAEAGYLGVGLSQGRIDGYRIRIFVSPKTFRAEGPLKSDFKILGEPLVDDKLPVLLHNGVTGPSTLYLARRVDVNLSRVEKDGLGPKASPFASNGWLSGGNFVQQRVWFWVRRERERFSDAEYELWQELREGANEQPLDSDWLPDSLQLLGLDRSRLRIR
jgi:hypothetical protein